MRGTIHAYQGESLRRYDIRIIDIEKKPKEGNSFHEKGYVV